MGRAFITIFSFPVVALIGCGGSQTGPAPQPVPVIADGAALTPAPETQAEPPITEGPDWLRGEPPGDLDPATHAFGVGVGKDTDQARERALIALSEPLLGPEASRPAVISSAPLTLHDPEVDPVRQETLSDGRAALLLAVPKSVFAMRLQQWKEAPMEMKTTDASTPTGALEAALSFLNYQRILTFACERQRALVGAECELADTTVARRQVSKVGRALRLESTWTDGIPYRPEEGPLRPAAVEARWTNAGGWKVPWPDLPLRFTGPEASLRVKAVKTTAEGRAEAPFDQPPAEPFQIRASVDATAVLGDLADLWPEHHVILTLRPVTFTSGRIGVYFRETILGDPSPDQTGVTATVRALGRLGFDRTYALGTKSQEILEGARGGNIAEAARRVGDLSLGRADFLIVGDIHSNFVSRMGARSVWHEASATIRILDAWTGREIQRIERTTRARGIGDHNAGRKALEAIGVELAEVIYELMNKKAKEAAAADLPRESRTWTALAPTPASGRSAP